MVTTISQQADTVCRDLKAKLLFEKHYGIILETLLARRKGVSPGAIAAARQKFWSINLGADDYILVRRFWKSMKEIQEQGLRGIPNEITSRLSGEENRIISKIFSQWPAKRAIFFAMPDISEQYRKGSLDLDEYLQNFFSRKFDLE